MAHPFMILAMRVIEILFFTGIVGCALVVVISWISIFRDGISNSHSTQAESQ
jgi:hypothetical protein